MGYEGFRVDIELDLRHIRIYPATTINVFSNKKPGLFDEGTPAQLPEVLR